MTSPSPITTRSAKHKPISEMSANSAAHTVFAAMELLETILLHLPPEDVVRNRRVNSTWKAACTASPQIRQHIFLEAKPIQRKLCWQPRRYSCQFARYHRRLGHLLSGDTPEGVFEHLSIVTLHPALEQLTKKHSPELLMYRDGEPESHFPAVFCKSDLLLWGPGQWRDMFITNPPCKRIWGDKGHIVLDVEDGITFGILQDAYKSDAVEAFGGNEQAVDEYARQAQWRGWFEVYGCLLEDCLWVKEVEDEDQWCAEITARKRAKEERKRAQKAR